MKIDSILDDYANHKVPKDKRKSLWHLCIILFAAIVTIPLFMVSQSIISNVGFKDAVIATVVSFIIITILISFTAYIGAKTNLTTAMISRITFGNHGGKIVSLVLGLALLMWFGITIDFFGASLSNILYVNFRIYIPVAIITAISGLLMMSSAIIGFKGLDKVSIFFTPIIIGIFAIMLHKVFQIDNAVAVLMEPKDGTLNMAGIISVWIGGCAAGIVLPSDITRFAKSAKEGMLSYIFSILIIAPIVSIVAMVLLKISGQDSFSGIVSFLNIGFLGAILLFSATWTTNDNNLYSSALSISVLFSKIAKWKIATVLGVLGVVLGVSQIFAYFIPILTILGVCIVPIAGIIIADYFLINKGSYNLETPNKNWNITAMFTWLVVSVLGILTTPVSTGGLGVFMITTIPAIDSLLFGFTLYVMLEKLRGVKSNV